MGEVPPTSNPEDVSPVPAGLLNSAVRSARPLQSSAVRSYHEKVIDHYENPRNVGSLDKADKNVGTGIVGEFLRAPACGDVMKLQIKVRGRERNDRGREVQDVRLRLGDRELLVGHRGKNIDFASKVKNDQIAKELSLPPVKLHCSMLAHDAIQAALKDYQSKKESVECIG
ncbi:Iron-sulfur cluster assembly enzyme ISCU, mitochondrial [Aphelenchoides fujianensis]|nr:Iron-sulfur cluster assembly enzyme ISCU, mitochondrial [Aphelenchoides fujianensis]